MSSLSFPKKENLKTLPGLFCSNGFYYTWFSQGKNHGHGVLKIDAIKLRERKVLMRLTLTISTQKKSGITSIKIRNLSPFWEHCHRLPRPSSFTGWPSSPTEVPQPRGQPYKATMPRKEIRTLGT